MGRKPSVSMTQEEITRFLESQSVAAACTVGRDGNLVARAITYKCKTGNLELDLTGPAGDLENGPVCIVADDCPSYHEIKGALIQGKLARAGDTGAVTISRASGFDFSKAPRPGGEK